MFRHLSRHQVEIAKDEVAPVSNPFPHTSLSRWLCFLSVVITSGKDNEQPEPLDENPEILPE